MSGSIGLQGPKGELELAIPEIVEVKQVRLLCVLERMHRFLQ